MDCKKVFTPKRMADIAEAYQMLQVAIKETREAFIEAAQKEEPGKVFWPMFDLQIQNAVNKVTSNLDYFPGFTNEEGFRILAFRAFGEQETVDMTEHLNGTSEVVNLALAGKNPGEIARGRRRKQLDADAEAIARVKVEQEAERVRKQSPAELLLEEEERIARGETPRERNLQDIERRLSK